MRTPATILALILAATAFCAEAAVAAPYYPNAEEIVRQHILLGTVDGLRMLNLVSIPGG